MAKEEMLQILERKKQRTDGEANKKRKKKKKKQTNGEKDGWIDGYK